MNSGRYLGSISAESHAKAVIDKLGWENETIGHWVHASRDWLLKYEPFKSINSSINGSRKRAFLEEKKKKEEEEMLAKKPTPEQPETETPEEADEIAKKKA